MTNEPRCLHRDGDGRVCQRPLGHPFLANGEHGPYYVEPEPSANLKRVTFGDCFDGGSACRECRQETRHESDCWLYIDKLIQTVNRTAKEKDELRRNFIAYRKENPSRDNIKRTLERRARHIVDLQRALTERNEQIEELVRELTHERDKPKSDPEAVRERTFRIEQLEAQVFVLGNEKERLAEELTACSHRANSLERAQELRAEELRTTKRLLRTEQHKVAEQRIVIEHQTERIIGLNAWSAEALRNTSEADLLAELTRRAEERNKQ